MKLTLAMTVVVLLVAACGPEAEKTVVLNVTGTMCQTSCAPALEHELRKVEGVRLATVTHATGTAEIVCFESVAVEDLIAAVQISGSKYRASLREVKGPPSSE